MIPYEVAIPVGVVGVVALTVKWGYEAWRRRDAVARTIHTMRAVYRQLHALAAQVTADRLMMVECANGGGVPRPGARLYVTITHEVAIGSLPSILDDWQRVPVTPQYLTEVLVPMLTAGHVRLETRSPTLPEELADVYRASGITSCEVYSAVMTPTGWHYLVAHYTSPMGATDADRRLLRSGAARIGRTIAGRTP